MSRDPMFKLAPSGDHYLVNLAGVLLICGDVIHGNPSETTPEGRARSKIMVDRILTEATARGFTQSDTVRSLLRRNKGGGRLMNLAQQAVDLIPKPLQERIMEEMLRSAPADLVPQAVPLDIATGQVDPRFWEAGLELQRVADSEGREAIHKPEHAHLFADLHRYAPEPLKSEMASKAKEMGLLPQTTHVGEDGQAVYSAEQLAATHGVTVDEIHTTLERAGMLPEDLYTGAVHPLQ